MTATSESVEDRVERLVAEAELADLAHELVVVAHARRRAPAGGVIIFIAGDSRMSPTPAL